MKKVMFVCKKNSRRSQMAEGFANTLGAGKIQVFSSGLAASEVDPISVQVMAEIGIDISQQSSKALSDFNLKIYPNELICLVGQSGCGKSDRPVNRRRVTRGHSSKGRPTPVSPGRHRTGRGRRARPTAPTTLPRGRQS